MKKLATENKFHITHNTPRIRRKTFWPYAEQYELASNLGSTLEPTIYFEHINYINFTTFGLPRPIYINMVRDPVERVISWYYYIRTPWYYVDRMRRFPNIILPDPNRLNMNLENCLKRKLLECSYAQNQTNNAISESRQTVFFCGHSGEDCFPFNSIRALQIAKRNVDADYAVVGSWEDTNVTLAVLEAYIPRFFKGAITIYNKFKSEIDDVNRNTYKPEISEKTKELIRQNFTNEIEFYKFCKQRLYKQYFALNLDSKFKIN